MLSKYVYTDVNVLLSNIIFYDFAVFDMLLAVNMCINYSFLHLYLQFYYSIKYLKFKK